MPGTLDQHKAFRAAAMRVAQEWNISPLTEDLALNDCLDLLLKAAIHVAGPSELVLPVLDPQEPT